MACRVNRVSMWTTRMMHELKEHAAAVFVTLTYETPPPGGSVQKADLQKFFKRLRKNSGKKVRYYAGGEYGTNYHRPHYHAVVYGLGKQEKKVIDLSWGLGFTSVGDVNEKTCAYVAKYIMDKKTGKETKFYEEKKLNPEFAVMSRRPGIGARYIEKYQDEIAQRGFCLTDRKQVPIPRFYLWKMKDNPKIQELREERQKIRGDEERKKVLENVTKNGYQDQDNVTILQRQSVKNNLEGRMRLKRGKL